MTVTKVGRFAPVALMAIGIRQIWIRNADGGGLASCSRQAIADASPYARMRLLCELHRDGPQRMADLASALDVTPRNVTTLVDGLEREGIVQRRPHPTDRRATVIELTDSADGALERSMEHEAAIGELFEKLAPTDRAALIRLMGDLESRMGPDARLAAP